MKISHFLTHDIQLDFHLGMSSIIPKLFQYNPNDIHIIIGYHYWSMIIIGLYIQLFPIQAT